MKVLFCRIWLFSLGNRVSRCGATFEETMFFLFKETMKLLGGSIVYSI